MGELPSADDIWKFALPDVSSDPAINRYYNFLGSTLPSRYVDYLYKAVSADSNFVQFLGLTASTPYPRFAAVLGVLDTIAKDSQFAEEDRRRINQEKMKRFFEIIAKEKSAEEGGVWPTEFMVAMQAQASRIFDDCHLYTHLVHWDQMRPFFEDRASKDQKQQRFDALYGMISSKLNSEMMKVQYIGAGQSVDALQVKIYSFFIKLGLLERSIEYQSDMNKLAATATDMTQMIAMIQKAIAPSIPQTHICIKNLCEKLTTQAVGELDDTTRAQIRDIPNRLTSPKSDFKFVSAAESMRNVPIFNPGVDIIEWAKKWQDKPIDITTVWGWLMGPKFVQDTKGNTFIREQAPATMVWVD